MSYTLKQTGAQIDTNLTGCDLTVANITARDAIDTTNGRTSVGKQCHVLNDGTGHKATFEWNGSTWVPLALDRVLFDTTSTPIPEEGLIGWDTDAQTLFVGLANGVTLQVGQELYIRAKNVQGVQINNGQAVYISGASGNRAEVMLANASNTSALATIAIATEDIGNNQNGFFTTNGIVRDLDTSAWSEGDPLYLSTINGTITNVKPSKPNYCVCIGYVIVSSATVGQIMVRINNTAKLGELSDVDLTGLTNGDQIYYDSATLTWKRIEAGFNAVSRWNDIVMPTEVLGVGASAPDLVPLNGSNLRMYGFNGVSTVEQLYGSFEVIHDYKEGTDLRPHIHWCPTTTGTGNVKWQMEYEIQNVNDTFTGVTSTITAIDSADGIAYQGLAVEFGIIDGTNLHIGAQCKFRIFRDPTDAQDTYGADAGLLTLGVHYEIDGDGSRNTFTK